MIVSVPGLSAAFAKAHRSEPVPESSALVTTVDGVFACKALRPGIRQMQRKGSFITMDKNAAGAKFRALT